MKEQGHMTKKDILKLVTFFFLTFAKVKQGHGHMQSHAQEHKLPCMCLLYMPRKQINLG